MSVSSAAHVRPARGDDIPSIRAVAWASWSDTYRTILSPRAIEAFVRAAYSERSLRATLARGGLLVLDVDGEVRGYLRLDDGPASEDGHPGRLSAIYLHPDEIGRGLGRRLWEAARTWFEERGVTTVDLEVASGNERARRFYEHLGFAPIETRTFEVLGESSEAMTYRLHL